MLPFAYRLCVWEEVVAEAARGPLWVGLLTLLSAEKLRDDPWGPLPGFGDSCAEALQPLLWMEARFPISSAPLWPCASRVETL